MKNKLNCRKCNQNLMEIYYYFPKKLQVELDKILLVKLVNISEFRSYLKLVKNSVDTF